MLDADIAAGAEVRWGEIINRKHQTENFLSIKFLSIE
jgi:hypothetical protein